MLHLFPISTVTKMWMHHDQNAILIMVSHTFDANDALYPCHPNVNMSHFIRVANDLIFCNLVVITFTKSHNMKN